MDENRGLLKTKIGRVTSNKMDKTIVITCERRIQHPIYKKFIRKSSKFMAHDEKNECQEGDIVKIGATRPLSKRKRWRVIEVIEKSK
jgi:small subunit ribosomal protein S17